MNTSIKGKLKFTTLNLENFKTRSIFTVENDFPRRFRRGRIRICNNPSYIVISVALPPHLRQRQFRRRINWIPNCRFWREEGVWESSTRKIPLFAPIVLKKCLTWVEIFRKINRYLGSPLGILILPKLQRIKQQIYSSFNISSTYESNV